MACEGTTLSQLLPSTPNILKQISPKFGVLNNAYTFTDIEEDLKSKFLVASGMAKPRQRRWYSDSLWAERSGDRSPVRTRFSSVQAGPGTQPVSYTISTGSFPVGKRPGRGVNHPPLSSTENKERLEL
jgi:hypothetical protein